MTFARHMYHYEGVTDLAKTRADALAASTKGTVVVHLHGCDERWRYGCPEDVRARKDKHEVYPPEEMDTWIAQASGGTTKPEGS